MTSSHGITLSYPIALSNRIAGWVVGYFQLIRIYHRNVMLNLVQHLMFLDPESSSG